MNGECTVFGGTIDPDAFGPELRRLLPDVDVRIVDGRGQPSFSKLINTCLLQCPTEIFVFVSDRVRPTPQALRRLLMLVGENYGVVGLFRFAFFGARKQLFREIGWFDEQYRGGGYEDCDILYRLLEARIGQYESEEVEYHKGKSRWAFRSFDYHRSKWLIEPGSGCVYRRLPETDPYPRTRLGPPQPVDWQPWTAATLLPESCMHDGWYVSSLVDSNDRR